MYGSYLKPELLWCNSDPTESHGLLNLTVKPQPHELVVSFKLMGWEVGFGRVSRVGWVVRVGKVGRLGWVLKLDITTTPTSNVPTLYSHVHTNHRLSHESPK